MWQTSKDSQQESAVAEAPEQLGNTNEGQRQLLEAVT
jgi:hypothetical protein